MVGVLYKHVYQNILSVVHHLPGVCVWSSAVAVPSQIVGGRHRK